MLNLPLEAVEVTENDLKNVFPPREIFEKWYRGEHALWPPEPEMGHPEGSEELRFDIGQQVLCRVGPTDWASGTVIQLWYRESSWPEWVYAPYKIRLDDGRCIFAPQDMDQIIKLNPNASSEIATNDSIDSPSVNHPQDPNKTVTTNN
jgi:hypothetical protein